MTNTQCTYELKTMTKKADKCKSFDNGKGQIQISIGNAWKIVKLAIFV